LATGAALLLSSSVAGAGVIVRGSDSSMLDATRLDTLVELELGKNSDVDEVTIDVTAGRASVALKRHSGSIRTGDVDLSTANNSDVERTLALFIGELSREVDPPVVESAPVAPPPSTTTAEGSSDVTTSPRALAPIVMAGGTARMFASGALVLGPFLSGGVSVGERLRVGGIARYGVASASDVLGTVDAKLLSLGPTADYRLLEQNRLSVHAGVGLEAGWIHGSAEGVETRSASGYGVAGFGFLELRWTPRPLVVALALEGGWLAPGLDLRAGTRTVLAISGGLAGASFGIGLDL
jgi:hypothetical protein